MADKKWSRPGPVCAVLLAVSYAVVGLSYLFLPLEQRGGTLLHDPEKFLVSMAQSPTLITVHHMAFGIGALLGLAVVFAVFDLTRLFHESWARWLSGLGTLGFAVTAIDNFKIVATEPVRAARYVAGDAAVKAIIKQTDFLVSIDPHMWIGYGLVGVWVLGTSWILLRNRAVHRIFGALGICIGLVYFFVEVGTVLRSEAWLAVAAAFGAIIAGPVWYVWLATILREQTSRPQITAS